MTTGQRLINASKEARALAAEVRETVSAAQARENRARDRREQAERASGPPAAVRDAGDGAAPTTRVEGEHDGMIGGGDE